MKLQSSDGEEGCYNLERKARQVWQQKVSGKYFHGAT